MRWVSGLIIFFLFLPACAVISKEVRQQAIDVSFSDIKGNIEKYKGSVVLWGGTIVKAEITNQGSMLEVVQKPVNRAGEITDPDVSEGRFLALYKGYLDPAIYRKQRDVTIAGRLIGSEERTIDEASIIYPIVDVIEIYLWKEPTYFREPFYYYPPYWYYPWGYPYIYPYPYPYPYYPPP